MTVKYVSKSKIRAKFNSGNYQKMIAQNQLLEKRIYCKHLANPDQWQGPYCTRSQIIRYLDPNNKLVVEVHGYYRPDGSLGASGLPDPKRLVVSGVLWVLRP